MTNEQRVKERWPDATLLKITGNGSYVIGYYITDSAEMSCTPISQMLPFPEAAWADAANRLEKRNESC